MAQGRRIAGSPGTGHINFSDFARFNSTGAQRMADALAGQADGQGSAAMRGLDNLWQGFDDAVRDGTLTYDANGLDAERAAYLGNEGYRGPDGLASMPGYGKAMGDAQRAQQNNQRLAGLYGRGTALQDMYGKGQEYSASDQILDSALAGTAGGSRFQQLATQWAGLGRRASAMETNASAQAGDARANSTKAAERYAEAAPLLRQTESDTAQRLNDDWVARQEDAQMRAEEEQAERRRRRGPTPTPEGTTPGRKGADSLFKGW